MLIKIIIALMVISTLIFVVVRNDRQVSIHDTVDNKQPSSLGQIKETVEDAGALKNASTQEVELLETEDKLIDMVEEYEHVNDDPQLRQSHREKMAEQLSTYSEQVLPVALAKMKERELNKTE